MSKNLARVAAHFFPIFFLLWLAGCGGGNNDGASGGGTATNGTPGGGSTTTPAPTLELFAGEMGGGGTADGVGAVARFNEPGGVATDSVGNVYVADTSNNTIRKITPAGAVATLAGTAGVSGSTDATGAAARFNSPTSVATDSAGNVYVADWGNSTIRKITPAGAVTTLAGTAGLSGSTDATGAAASFSGPRGVATDSAGNVYVGDSSNNTIRKITPAGVVTTVAGAAGGGSSDGTGIAASFGGPRGVATDNAGNVYVADFFNNTIRKITPAGVVTTLAGTAGAFGPVTDGTGAAARFDGPAGVATDSAGNVYVADSGDATIRKITPAGVVTTLAGTANISGSTDATGAAASFLFPFGVATDSVGNVYVVDEGNRTIRKITPAGVVTTLAGTAAVRGSTDATGTAARFNGPGAVATDTAGNVYVGDPGTIRKITPAGVVSTLAGTPLVISGNKGAIFKIVGGIATDSAGNVYVADTLDCSIRKITPAGVVSTLAGNPSLPGSTDGTGQAAHFNFPQGIATDSAGNVYVADTFNHTIRKITPAGVVTTFAGTAGVTGSTDATGPAASFNGPLGMATDSAGNVYVADINNSTIRKITPAGVVTTLAGTAGVRGSTDATGPAASFDGVLDVATDSAGNIYVVDASNSTIRKITPAGAVSTMAGVAGQAGFVPGPLPGLLSPRGVAVSGTSLYITLFGGVAVVRNLP